MELNTKPVTHKVVETEEAVYIDDKKIEYVIEDSVKTEELGDKQIVTLSFIAQSFEEMSEREFGNKF